MSSDDEYFKKTDELLEKLSKIRELETDGELAVVLGVKKSQMSHYRMRRSRLGALPTLRIYDAIGYGWAKLAIEAITTRR